MKKPFHQDGPTCAGCDAKALECHSEMQSWFYNHKSVHPEMHIAWGFRGEAVQNELYKEKKTMRRWPLSKHNSMINGKPNSEAMDVFQIADGKAVFDPKFYFNLHQEDLKNESPIAWAGLWVSFKETMHFELDASKLISG